MNDRPTFPPASDGSPLDGAAPNGSVNGANGSANGSTNGSSNLRLPTGPPAGTSARGTLTLPSDDEGVLAAIDPALSDGLDEQPGDEAAIDHDWEVGESADGRPLESPYLDEASYSDEARLRAVLSSEEMRSSGAFDYPLDPDAQVPDFSHDDFAHNDFSRDDLALDNADELVAPALAVADGGAAPPSVPGAVELSDDRPSDKNGPLNDREMDLFEHLGELRTRILYCVVAIALAMTVTWNYARPLEQFIIRPAIVALKEAKVNSNITVISPTEGFMLQFNVSIISAIFVTMPFLLFQIWRFIEPAMTHNERKFTGIIVPFSSLLFFMGCGLAYVMSPLFFKFFAMFVPPDTLANWSFAATAELLAKMLLVCGICFQVPVFTIFLNKSGLVSRNVLIEYWRHVVVVIFIVVAVITPTWDPVSLAVCAVPPCLLYGLSIWLVKWL